MKFALVSQILPPDWGGQTVMLCRVLEGLDAEDYCLISPRDYDPGTYRGNGARRLPARYHRLPPEPQLKRGHRFGLERARQAVNVPLGVLARARAVARIVRGEGARAVVACTGDLLSLPAGYLASRLAGVPFYAYLFDYYSYSCTDPLERRYARLFERAALRGAAGIISPNEFLSDELRSRYGVESVVIRNPCDLSDYEGLPEQSPSPDGFRIVYTGAIYEAHYDAFRNLVRAINLLGRPGVKLHIYSASPIDWERQGIAGPVVRHGYRDMSAIPGIQREADLLFLPLAFESPYPVLIRTSATSKLGEYLASARPILVHAPADSFISWYFREHGCGLVVDRSEPAELARAIERAMDDEGLRRRIGERARERARADFSVGTAQDAFARLLGGRR
jgi:glycosyltransferase involved in cell wall biosynthesis